MLRIRHRLNHTHGFYILLFIVCVFVLREFSSIRESSAHLPDDATAPQASEQSTAIENAVETETPARTAIRGKHLRIMAIGDSVTAGAHGTNSYREKLIHLLHQNKVEMVGRVNWGTMKPAHLNNCEAYMAQSMWDIAPKLPPSVQKFKPNIILFHLGTNDVAWKKDVDTLPQRTEAVIDAILDEAPDAVLLVALIIPCAFRIDGVKQFNRQLYDIVMTRQRAGSQIIPVDMFSAFEFPKHPNFLADISHPNAEGYWVMAHEWQNAMEEANSLGWIKDPIDVKISNVESTR